MKQNTLTLSLIVLLVTITMNVDYAFCQIHHISGITEQIVQDDSLTIHDKERIKGKAIAKGELLGELYKIEKEAHNNTKKQLENEKVDNDSLMETINKLATELSKQPVYILTFDWKIVTLVSGLSVIVTILFMSQINK